MAGGKHCTPHLKRCAYCGRRGSCRKIKEVSSFFIEKYGIEHLLLTGLVVSNGAGEDGEEIFFWTQQAQEICRDLFNEIRGFK